MAARAHLAIDLGAESGRVTVGTLRGDRLALAEVHRFEHAPLPMPTGLHWDITGMWREILEGLQLGLSHAHAEGLEPASVGVDTWGVDVALIDAQGGLIGLPHAYRDLRTTVAFARAREMVSLETVYNVTGIQLMPINTLYQLIALRKTHPRMLDIADRLLFMPDLFHFLLGGEPGNERTIASTSQMMHAGAGDWATDLLAQFDLPTHMLGEVHGPGTDRGALRASLAALLHSTRDDVRIVAPPAHDTASAVAAVPAEPGSNWCYLSSGTWSLLGAEVSEPVLTSIARDANFTNEAAANGGVRFLKNIVGLWMVQECRRAFAERLISYDYSKLTTFAAAAEPFRTLLDTEHPPFLQPGDMPGKIAAYAAATGQPAPTEPGECVRACLEGLALAYRRTLDSLEHVLGRRFDVIHIVGGGSRNALLNQMTADATGRTVRAGPAEATAMGNVLGQAIGCGEVDGWDAARAIVRASSATQTFHPHETERWEQAASQLRAFRERAAAARA